MHDVAWRRYVIALDNGCTVRARRGNFVLTAPTEVDFITALHGSSTHDDMQLIERVYGTPCALDLISQLVSLRQREWTVADDLRLVADLYRVRDDLAACQDDIKPPPSKRPRRIDSPAETKSRVKCRLHMLRQHLSPQLVHTVLSVCANAAAFPEAIEAFSPPLWLAYDQPIMIHVCEHAALPRGHVVLGNPRAASVDARALCAAIPTEWRLQLAPSQFVLSDGSGDPLLVNQIYQLDDLTRDTLVSQVVADIGSFLCSQACLRMRLPAGVMDLLTLAWRDGDNYAPLPMSATAEAADMFNRGAASFEKTRTELVVTLKSLLPSPLPPSELHALCHHHGPCSTPRADALIGGALRLQRRAMRRHQHRRHNTLNDEFQGRASSPLRKSRRYCDNRVRARAQR